MKKVLSIMLTSAVLLCFCNGARGQNMFKNPLLELGPDPFSTYYNGEYIYTHTLQDSIVIWRTDDLSNLKNAESKTIFLPEGNTPYSKEIWAPEIHFLEGKWYVYFAADDGRNENHRMFVLENESEDPFEGEFILKGQLSAFPNRWAIDGNIYEYNGELFIAWSGWEGRKNVQQNIYLAKMKNPYTIEGGRVLLAEPTHNWEKQGDLEDHINPPHVSVNEGPQFLEHNGRIFIVFSANGCWTDFYNLGLLEFKGGNFMSPQNWVKHDQPIFSQSLENKVYASGHNSFFKSPDGTEDWILYHANPKPGQGCGNNRSPRMQKLSWSEEGLPILGIPVSTDTWLEKPSKEKRK